MRVYDVFKRLVDLVVASAVLILTSPLQVVIALAVRWQLGSPVFFRQPRPGKGGEVFVLVKFRTMLDPDPERGLVSDEERLVRLGRFLRSTSLDELPTLWNVLRGDMSLVGPRPLLVAYLDRYTIDQQRRHDVRPGITGLAQVAGRNALSWEEKFKQDLRYVDQRSLGLDLRILLRTVVQVLRRADISADGQATMPEFRGSPDA